MAEKIAALRVLRGNGENVMGKLALLEELPQATAQCIDADLEVRERLLKIE